VDLSVFEVLPGVGHVHRISAPYKLAGKAFRPQGTVVKFANGATIGGTQVALIAGPCSIENREQMFTVAASVAKAGGKFLRGGAFKPRSSPYSGAQADARSSRCAWAGRGQRGNGDCAD
jgi:3-deoxy-7-phosphoheptulonate synthase